MTIDRLYIDEAKRIRKVYLTNLANIVQKEEEIDRYFKMIEKIKDEVKDNESVTNEQFFIGKLLEINDNIEKIKTFIIPHYERIQELDGAQKILYNNIKDKYPDITDEEIQSQVMPHIIPIDEKFMKDNEDLYNKILSKEK